MDLTSERWGVGLAIALGAAYAAVWGWALSSQTYNIYGSLVTVPIIIAINLILITRALATAPEPWLAWILPLGLAAKLVGTFGRYWVTFEVYDGVADATRYHLAAAVNYQFWREGVFVITAPVTTGTRMMELITTGVYVFVGASPLAGFFVFASLAFWGTYFLFRAFCLAVPSGDHRRYALLLFFLPSMLYWPSSIGKESWLLLFVGMTALGAARMFAARHAGVVLILGGVAGLGVVRPHIAVLMVTAILVASLVRGTDGTPIGLLRKVAGVAVLGVAGAILTQASATFLGIDDLSAQAVTDSIDWSGARTQTGGSEFTPMPLSNPLGLPVALLTILFRPLPFEAANAQLLIQSAEGLFLVGLTLMSASRLRQLPSQLRHQPYVTFVVVFVVIFVIAFSGFSNFGILARQRVLMLPFFLVLLSLPKAQPAFLAGRPLRAGQVRPLDASRDTVMQR